MGNKTKITDETSITSNGVLCDEIKPHFYNGNGLQNIKCEDCKRDADDFIHYRNAGTICDNPKGACSCGAWH